MRGGTPVQSVTQHRPRGRFLLQFAGIANIRGNLHAVTDFSVFRGGAPTPQNANARLLLIGAKHGANAALLVSRRTLPLNR